MENKLAIAKLLSKAKKNTNWKKQTEIMNTAFYLETTQLNDTEVKDLIKYIHAAKGYECGITPHEIETRFISSEPVLIALTNGEKISIDLWGYDSLAEFGKEGYRLQSANDKLDFFTELTVGQFKYYK